MPETLSAPAPAKVNLVLEVLGRRPDGYHELATVIQTLELADEVTLTLGRTGIEVTGPYAGGTPADETNLGLRAIDALRARGVAVPGIHLAVEKRIPPAGGLGGGASDAATVIRLLQRLFGFPDNLALAAANAVGSDEAALALGGTVHASGRGDRVTPLPSLPRHGVVLFLPPGTIPSKTPRLFAALGTTPFDDGAVAAGFLASPPLAFAAVDVYNAFERVAFDVFHGLAELQADLEHRTGQPVRLAGAGPALFWIGPPELTPAIADRARGAACVVTTTATSRSLWRR